ncbi:unnamed protein product, partial [Rotaria magnacalcarata]
ELIEPFRLLLKYRNEPFEDQVYKQGDPPECSRKEFVEVRDQLGLTFPSLPYLFDYDDNVKMTQNPSSLIGFSSIREKETYRQSDTESSGRTKPGKMIV